MNKIILTKGLPASGKSTWAREYQEKNPNTVRINKDDLRAMMHNSIWSHGREQFILKVRNFIVEEALKEGHDVIVDDTNLHSKHKNEMWRIASAYNATVEEKSFLDVSVEECIKRDLKRPNSVGTKVIKGMYNQFINPKAETPAIDENLPTAVICDLDGTLALFGTANPYERDFSKDEVNMRVYELLNRLKEDRTIIILSGRKDTFREVTEKWLREHAIPHDALFMRKGDDNRKDFIIKRELYEAQIKGKYNVFCVFDDRDQVVELWRNLGLICFQVAEGDF